MGEAEQRRRSTPPFWLDLGDAEYREAIAQARLSATQPDFAVWLNIVDPAGSRLDQPIRQMQGPGEDDHASIDDFLDWVGAVQVETGAGTSTLRDFLGQALMRYNPEDDPLEPGYGQLVKDLRGLVLSRSDAEFRLGDLLSTDALDFLARFPFNFRDAAEWGKEFLELPLERQPYNAPREAAEMDAGSIPPNFVHTWAVDLSQDVDWFKLAFESLQDVQLQWNVYGVGDRLSVIDSCGNVLSRFGSLYEVQCAAVPLKQHLCQHDSKRPHKRIYFVLETSSVKAKRTFRLSKLRLLKPKMPSTEALLVDDPVNYATTGVLVGAKNETLYPPWYSSNQTGSMPATDEPDPKKGWYLLSINVTNATSQFYHAVYYNELESKLRFYLFNRTLPKVISGFVAEIRLFAQSGQAYDQAQYEELTGAIFAQGVRPKDWSVARVPIPQWEQGRWTCLEVPLFYPMAEKLPLDLLILTPPGNPYLSLYEDRFKAGMHNVKLEIKIIWQLVLDETSKLVAKALGDAVQKMPSQHASLADYAMGVWGSIKDGIDWGKKTHSFLDSLNTYSNDQNWGSIVQTLTKGVLPGVAMGVYSGIAGAAGAVVSLLQNLLAGDPEPLRLAIELGIRGEIKGVAQAKLQHATAWFYLPGRFSIEEAFDPKGIDGLPQNDVDFIDSVLPRYARTLGLFGYKYNPAEIRLPVDMLEHRRVCYPVDRQWVTPLVYLAPSYSPDPSKIKGMSKTLPRLLPVIRNEFAPWVFILPTSSAPIQGGSRSYMKVFYQDDTLYHDCGACIIDPDVELPEGVSMVVSNLCIPETYSSFVDQADVPFDYGDDSIVEYGGNVKSSPAWKNMFYWHCGTPTKDDTDIYPLHDVLYYWEIGYFVANRDGKISQLQAQLCAPVSINLNVYRFVNNKIQFIEQDVRTSLLLR